MVSRKASILIIALWSLCLLSMFAVYLGYTTRQKMTLVKRLDERSQLHYAAEAGVEQSIILLKKDAPKGYDSLKDVWSDNSSVFQDVDIGRAIYDVAYGYLEWESGSENTRYGLTDEERKININKARGAMLERLFSAVLGADQTQALDLAASVIDWRDKDSELFSPLAGAEDSYYRNTHSPYEAKDADFEVLEELLLVKGIDKDIFEKIKNYVTIYGNGKVNINTASEPALFAAGVSERLIDKIMVFRRGADGLEATDDDGAFPSVNDIVPLLSQSSDLSESDVAELSGVAQESLAVSSENFMIRSIARLPRGNATLTVTCVADKKGRILYWNER